MTAFHEVDGSIVQDFARRTLANLEFIDQHYALYKDGKSNTEVYEVTQFINSLLGLLVFPKEEFWRYVKAIPLADIPSLKISQYQTNNGERLRPCTNLKELIVCLRNGVSHFHVSFKNNQRTTYITGLEIWDIDPRTKKIHWKAYVDVFDLKKFVLFFINGVISGDIFEH